MRRSSTVRRASTSAMAMTCGDRPVISSKAFPSPAPAPATHTELFSHVPLYIVQAECV